jgi:hypothetical protein
MARVKLLVLIVCLALFYPVRSSAYEADKLKSQVLYPNLYIKILKWSIYSVRGVAIVHHVTIENTGDLAYKNIRVRIHYLSGSYSNYGTKVAVTTGILPIVVPPRSKNTYLKGGAVLGAGSSNFIPGAIEVLGATPVDP